jgi:hypothetical protein
MISLPNATGLNPLCPAEAFPFFGVQNNRCIVLQGGWGLGYLVLWALATFCMVRVIWQGWKGTSLLKPDWLFAERQNMIRQCCQLMLLVSAGGTILLYALSPAAAAFPGPTARYLVCLLVATPATLWPLWNGVRVWRTSAGWRVNASLFARGCLLLLILAMFVVGTFRTVTELPEAQAAYWQQDQLVQKLRDLGAVRIYSEYWTCNRLIFQSGEKIICSALDEHLDPGFDRYAPYRDIVRRVPEPAYVFPQGAQQIAALDGRMKKDSQFSNTYRRLIFENYVIYVPKNQARSANVFRLDSSLLRCYACPLGCKQGSAIYS